MSESTNSGSRKPRLALMGEFSAGKSTLSNLLMGARPLPEKVTATRLPPVRISHGIEAPYYEDLDGVTHPISLETIEDVPFEDTRLIHIFMESEILEVCDLIDMPGISDPNMSSEVWERAIHLADGVLWCTHATQAWRQSESAVWETLPAMLRPNSLLLITRFDKIINEKDRGRVIKRVTRETEGLFAQVIPVSLLRALEADGDEQKWINSGAEALYGALGSVIDNISSGKLADDESYAVAPPSEAYQTMPEPTPEPEPEPAEETLEDLDAIFGEADEGHQEAEVVDASAAPDKHLEDPAADVVVEPTEAAPSDWPELRPDAQPEMAPVMDDDIDPLFAPVSSDLAAEGFELIEDTAEAPIVEDAPVDDQTATPDPAFELADPEPEVEDTASADETSVPNGAVMPKTVEARGPKTPRPPRPDAKVIRKPDAAAKDEAGSPSLQADLAALRAQLLQPNSKSS
jgi:hypothetical protein